MGIVLQGGREALTSVIAAVPGLPVGVRGLPGAFLAFEWDMVNKIDRILFCSTGVLDASHKKEKESPLRSFGGAFSHVAIAGIVFFWP